MLIKQRQSAIKRELRGKPSDNKVLGSSDLLEHVSSDQLYEI